MNHCFRASRRKPRLNTDSCTEGKNKDEDSYFRYKKNSSRKKTSFSDRCRIWKESLKLTNLKHENQFISILRNTPWFMEALMTVRRLNLTSWCIGAGILRNIVWDHLHGYDIPCQLNDIDVAYFDSQNISAEQDHEFQKKLFLGLFP